MKAFAIAVFLSALATYPVGASTFEENKGALINEIERMYKDAKAIPGKKHNDCATNEKYFYNPYMRKSIKHIKKVGKMARTLCDKGINDDFWDAYDDAIDEISDAPPARNCPKYRESKTDQFLRKIRQKKNKMQRVVRETKRCQK